MSNQSIQLTGKLYKYLCDVSLREMPVLKKLREETLKMNEASCQISPEQGQFMQMLVKLMNVKKALEIGVFTGYSSISVASALPEDGKLIALDINVEYTSTAREYWIEAGVDHKIDLRIAPAVQSLKEMQTSENFNSFDFVFIDADKSSYDAYYELTLPLLKQNGLIIFDNVLRDGRVADTNINDPDTIALRELNEKLLNDERVDISMLPVADGLTLVRKK